MNLTYPVFQIHTLPQRWGRLQAGLRAELVAIESSARSGDWLEVPAPGGGRVAHRRGHGERVGGGRVGLAVAAHLAGEGIAGARSELLARRQRERVRDRR